MTTRLAAPVASYSVPIALTSYDVTQTQIAVGSGGIRGIAVSPACRKKMRAAMANQPAGEAVIGGCVNPKAGK